MKSGDGRRIMLLHQQFLSSEDAGGSRWNQMVQYLEDYGVRFDVIAGNVHYSTGKPQGRSRIYSREPAGRRSVAHRVWTHAGYNVNFVGRLMGYMSYTLSSFLRGLTLRGVDIVLVSSPPLFAGVSGALLARLGRKPFVLEVRDLWPESAIAAGVVSPESFLVRLMYWLERRLYAEAHRIVVLTPAFAEDIRRRFPRFGRKIEVIPNGADFALMGAEEDRGVLRRKLGWQGRFIASYFGAHGVANDLDQLLQVAVLLGSTPRILITLIGDGMEKPGLMKRASDLGLQNIEFLGPIPKKQIGRYIRASDVCLAVLRKAELFKTIYPNKVFDYMACERPVLVAIEGITRELVERAKCGDFVEPGDAPGFAACLRHLAESDPAALEELGRNGYHYALRSFDRRMLARRYAVEVLGLLDTRGDGVQNNPLEGA